jgi:predicted transporter
LAGVLSGAVYGLLVGAVMFLWTYEDRYAPYPGPLIPNKNEVARLVTAVAAVVGVACGVLVGLTVGLSGVGKWRAGTMGFALGLAVMAVTSYHDNVWQAVVTGDWPYLRNLLLLFAILPCGLALTGVAVSAVAGMLGSHR